MKASKTRKIPVVEVDARREMSRLRARIRRYERRYETTSEEMLDLISTGKSKETAEILRWMFDYHELRFLDEKTRTNGKTMRGHSFIDDREQRP